MSSLLEVILAQGMALSDLVAGTVCIANAPPRETRFRVSRSETQWERDPKRRKRDPKEDRSLSVISGCRRRYLLLAVAEREKKKGGFGVQRA